MRMGIGLGVGINRSNYAQGIFGAYQSRVVADGGTTEAGGCVDAVSGLLLSASLLLIPSGYKSLKLYSQIPTNGNGDFTWARTSSANRTNSSGNIELMATGVPRLSYMYGSCPAVLLEPQRTNLLQNSGWVGGGTTPTSWTLVVGSGTSTPTTSIKNNSVTAYRFTGTSQRQIFAQTIAVTNAVTYSVSVYVESITTATQIIQMLLVNGSGTSTYYRNNVLANASDTIVAGFTYTIVFVATATANADFRFGLGCNSNSTADYILSMPQLEVGAYPTTFILSPVSATATRVADSFSRNNIYTNGLITSSGGTWFVEFRNNVDYTRNAPIIGFSIRDNINPSIGNNLEIRCSGSSSQRLTIGKRISGVFTALYLTTTDTTKIAIKWDGTSADVFVNGVKQISATPYTTTLMEFLSADGGDVPKFIQQMALYPSPLSDTDCTTITTL
jgi:hypothetical protein